MATVSLPEPPPPFSCSVCEQRSVANKLGNICRECPSFKGTHYFPTGHGDIDYADIVVVGDAPSLPRKQNFDITMHRGFEEEAGRVIRNAVSAVQKRQEAYKWLRISYVYAVRCAVDTPSKATIASCAMPLKRELGMYALKKSNKLTVLACGVTALHSLGINVRSEKEALGRVYTDVPCGSATLTVVFTRSLKSLGTAVGKHSSLLADVERAIRLAVNMDIRQLPRETVEREYVYPTTLEEVRSLIDTVIAYKGTYDDPLQWPISFDTETNTLHPHWSGTKLVAVSFAWDVGKAATIPLWHKETPYDPAAAYQEVRRLLFCGKPTIWFNAKYDFKVFWRMGEKQGEIGTPHWDVFLAEHALEEDKKGQYNLKFLTKQDIPQLSGYEDRLREELEQQDAANWAEVAVNDNKIVKLPHVIAEALEVALSMKQIDSANFRANTVEKLIKSGKYSGEDQDRLVRLLNAKKNKEFTGASYKASRKKKKQQGGYENVSLRELFFYAAVDADCTLRLAYMQYRRMAAENRKYNALRKQVTQDAALGPNKPPFEVQVLCPDTNPLLTLVEEGYMPRQTELAKIEYNGININQEYLAWGEVALDNTIATTTQSIFEICGESFALGSGKKKANFLFWGGKGFKHPDPELAARVAEENPDTVRYVDGWMSYKPAHYTGIGQLQTNAAVMKHLISRYKCPLANLLMSLAKADTAKHSFFENITKLSHMFGDGRIHPGYNLTGTSTGRLSSSSGVEDIGFNNQNIPRGLLGAMKNARGELIRGADGKPVFEGVKCKRLFIPDDPIYCFGNADAKGAEVSIFAGYAMDKALIEALIAGMDAHCYFASQALNPDLVGAGLSGADRKFALEKAGIDDQHAWSYEDFIAAHTEVMQDKAYAKRLSELRTNIKRLVFGMLYGAGVKKIAEIAGIKLELAQQIKNLLFSRFPSIQTYMDRTIWEMREFNMVETYQGRRRRFLLGRNAPSMLMAKAERQAINFKIQSTSSDIVLTVLCWVAEVIERDLRGRLLLTVHDSIGFQVPKQYAHQVSQVFKELGTDRVAKACPWLPVPYRWDVELGPSYGDTIAASKYLASLPPPAPVAELDGYVEEEIFDDLRDPDSFEMPAYKKAPKALTG